MTTDTHGTRDHRQGLALGINVPGHASSDRASKQRLFAGQRPTMLVRLAVLGGVLVGTCPGLVGAVAHAAENGPTITNIIPASRSNTLYASQPLSATVQDAVPITSVTFSLRDLTAGTTRVVPTATPITVGALVTEPVTLVEGHIYSVAVTASDALGGTTTVDQGTDAANGFLAITASATPARVEVTQTTATTVTDLSGMVSANFPHVLANADSVRVVMSGTQHPGFGYAQLNVPLGSLQICATVSGSHVCETASGGAISPTLLNRLIDLQFVTNTVSPSEMVDMATGSLPGIDIGPISATVPQGWTNISLQSTSIDVSTTFPTCSSPRDANFFPDCAPDPLRFYSEDRTASIAQHELNNLAATSYSKDPARCCSPTPTPTLAVVPTGADTTQPCGASTYSIAVASPYPVTLSASGGPEGSSASFDPTTLAGNGTATLTQTIPCDTAIGSYAGTVSATCSVANCTPGAAAYKLTVSQAPSTSIPSATAVVVAPPIGAALQCGSASYTLVVATNQPVTLGGYAGAPGNTTTIVPSSLSASGTATLTQSIPCGTVPGPYVGWVYANGCNTGLGCCVPVQNCLNDWVPYYTSDYETIVGPGLDGTTVGAQLQELWINPCVAPVPGCHEYPFAVAPQVPAAPLADVPSPYVPVTYPRGYLSVAPFQYPSVCSIGACAQQLPAATTSGSTCRADQSNCYYTYINYGTTLLPEACADANPCSATNGTPIRYWFNDEGNAYSCAASAQDPNRANCGDSRYGYSDDDGSNDGVAIGWGGSWGINFQSAEADYWSPDGSCQNDGSWSFTTASGNRYSGTLPPQVTNFSPNTDALGIKAVDDDGAICGGVSLFGIAASADESELTYHTQETSLVGEVEHSTSHTDWNWQFSCGAGGGAGGASGFCSVGASPAEGNDTWETPPDAQTYDY